MPSWWTSAPLPLLLFVNAEVKEVEMLPVADHNGEAQQPQTSQPSTPTPFAGNIVDAASFVAHQHPR